MNIVISSDDRGYKLTKILFHTLKNSNPGAGIHIWFLNCGNIRGQAVNQLKDYCVNAGWDFTDVDADNGNLQTIYNLLSVKRRDNLRNKSNFSRILIPYILPEETGRCLWLDIDNIIINPLGKVYNLEMGDACIAHTMTEDLHWAPPIRTAMLFYKHKVPAASYGENSAVLYNLKACREIPLDDIIALLEESGHLMELYDQDLYNVLYYGKKTQLPTEYNLVMFQGPYGTVSHAGGSAMLDERWDRIATDELAIIHGAGRVKASDPRFKYYQDIKGYLPVTDREE